MEGQPMTSEMECPGCGLRNGIVSDRHGDGCPLREHGAQTHVRNLVQRVERLKKRIQVAEKHGEQAVDAMHDESEKSDPLWQGCAEVMEHHCQEVLHALAGRSVEL